MSLDTRVKICGVTTAGDALAAARAGADMLGLNFYPPSPRCLTAKRAQEIANRLRGELGDRSPTMIGVFVNEGASRIADICEELGLDAAQLSGDEAPGALRAPLLRQVPAFKSLRPRSAETAQRDAQVYVLGARANEHLPSLLLDAWHPDLYGGSGEQTPDDVARAVLAMVPRLMLAGGLNPENVAERVCSLRPWGVDVASGVESAPGVKDAGKMRAFIAAAKGL
ncbi:MAG: phosphoribosylanthranilate isomerase [Anaerolineaceae bacterium]|nr:phosphoribosylanthranilate isomerase [Anaerolineaceae bacterium]